jgi:curved DNA-binding protein CbpA
MADPWTGDPYAVLGVPRNATPLQVARAHRRLAKRHHPDIHGEADASERMRRINQAFQILSNPVRRMDYDRRHPDAGTPASGHWAASRRIMRPAPPTSTRTWASWRASASETIEAPRTSSWTAEMPMPRTRRPAPPIADEAGFLQSGWAALVVAALVVLLVIAAAFAGNLSAPPLEAL